MRTSIDIPDDLLREAKAKAALEDRTLKEIVIEGLRQFVKRPASKRRPLRRVKFPIIESTGSGRKITDDMVNEAVEQMYREEADYYAQFMRR